MQKTTSSFVNTLFDDYFAGSLSREELVKQFTDEGIPVAEAMLSLVTDDDPNVQTIAIEFVGYLKGEFPWDSQEISLMLWDLITEATTPDIVWKQAAITLNGYLQYDPIAFEGFMAHLPTSNNEIKKRLLWTLTWLGGELPTSLLDFVLSGIINSNLEMRKLSIDVLRAIKNDVTSTLIEKCQEENDEFALKYLVEAISALGNEEAFAHLIDLVFSDRRILFITIYYAILKNAPTSILNELREELITPSRVRSSRCIWILRDVGPDRLIDKMLTDIHRATSPSTINSFLSVFKGWQDDRTTQAVIEIYLGTTLEPLKISALDTLDSIGSPRALEFVKQASTGNGDVAKHARYLLLKKGSSI